MPKQKSILNNGIYNFIKTFANLAFPIVTFSYSSRILGEAGIGQANFSSSFISYFSMLALLGMNYYGVREGAKLRDDKDKFSKFAQEMLIINGVTTVLAYILLAVAMIFVPKLHEYWILLLVFSVNILFNGLGLDWLYASMEEYRYITVRSLIFKCISFAALFIFVHDANDVIAYSLVQITGTTGSHILNFIYARKFILFKHYDGYEIKKHLKPILWLFAMALSIELYTVLDTTMIGFMLDDAAVGRYTAATKINKMVISTVTSIGYVAMPRFSYYLKKKMFANTTDLARKLFNYIFLLTVPAAVGLFMLSDAVILLFSGAEFENASITMRILTPIIVIIPMSSITNVQILIPLNKENLILRATMTGAVTNFIFNMLLIPHSAENGAALATVIAESAVTVISLLHLRKYYSLKDIFKYYYQYWIAATAIPAVIILFNIFIDNYLLRVLVEVPVAAGCYFLVLLMFKNQYLIEVAGIFLAKANGFIKKLIKRK